MSTESRRLHPRAIHDYRMATRHETFLDGVRCGIRTRSAMVRHYVNREVEHFYGVDLGPTGCHLGDPQFSLRYVLCAFVDLAAQGKVTRDKQKRYRLVGAKRARLSDADKAARARAVGHKPIRLSRRKP